MTSANSVTAKSTAKIHSDHQPRRLARKFCRRRRVMGVRVMLLRIGAALPWTGFGVAVKPAAAASRPGWLPGC
jgi:hypothetical protein